MMTFKQLEAIYWVTQLGGFSQAADKLHTTQSAISKRVQELETLFGTPLFDRTQRTSRLTEKGEEKLWAKTSANGWATEMEGLADFMFEFGQVSVGIVVAV